ncbi:hypothetical protein J6590_011977 [Homalodisca vitripennis]|nr:hypothetical protein J6590_011977 [Homalodisca vitripennis]
MLVYDGFLRNIRNSLSPTRKPNRQGQQAAIVEAGMCAINGKDGRTILSSSKFIFLLLQRLVSDAVSDLTPGIWSRVRLKSSNESRRRRSSKLFDIFFIVATRRTTGVGNIIHSNQKSSYICKPMILRAKPLYPDETKYFIQIGDESLVRHIYPRIKPVLSLQSHINYGIASLSRAGTASINLKVGFGKERCRENLIHDNLSLWSPNGYWSASWDRVKEVIAYGGEKCPNHPKLPNFYHEPAPPPQSREAVLRGQWYWAHRWTDRVASLHHVRSRRDLGLFSVGGRDLLRVPDRGLRVYVLYQ